MILKLLYLHVEWKKNYNLDRIDINGSTTAN